MRTFTKKDFKFISYKSQYLGFRDFIYKVLVKRKIDKLIAGVDIAENEEENVIPISKKNINTQTKQNTVNFGKYNLYQYF